MAGHGGPHAQTLFVLRTVSGQISRRRNVSSTEQVLQQLHDVINGNVEEGRQTGVQLLASQR